MVTSGGFVVCEGDKHYKSRGTRKKNRVSAKNYEYSKYAAVVDNNGRA